MTVETRKVSFFWELSWGKTSKGKYRKVCYISVLWHCKTTKMHLIECSLYIYAFSTFLPKATVVCRPLGSSGPVCPRAAVVCTRAQRWQPGFEPTIARLPGFLNQYATTTSIICIVHHLAVSNAKIWPWKPFHSGWLHSVTVVVLHNWFQCIC